MIKHRCLIFSVLALLSTLNSNAQIGKFFNDNSKRFTTVGVSLGTSHYLGDLAPYSVAYYSLYTNVRWNAAANYTMHINPKLAARLQFSYVRLFGNDETYGGRNNFTAGTNKLRNLHFRNDLKEISLSGLYHFVNLDNFRKGEGMPVSPYIGAGLSLIAHDPKARGSLTSQLSNPVVEIQDYVRLRNKENNLNMDGTIKSYSSMTIGIPVNLGVKARIKDNWIIGLEGTIRYTFTDYLDDIGEKLYNVSSELSYRAKEDYSAYSGKSREEQFRSAVQATPKYTGGNTNVLFPSQDAEQYLDPASFRGTKWNDVYYTIQLSLNYIISNRIKCPPLK